MRRILIDTDTASDDAIALVMALRDAREAAVGDRIRLRLHTGSLDCRVEDVHGT